LITLPFGVLYSQNNICVYYVCSVCKSQDNNNTVIKHPDTGVFRGTWVCDYSSSN